MNSIINSHDLFFKETMAYVEIAKDFLKCYLPQEIKDLMDFDTMRLAKDCYTNKDLESFFSDLLYEVDFNKKSAFVYFLFEHKSTPYFYTAFKLLEYMVRIWGIFIKQQESKTRVKLPLIIPIVYYHGFLKMECRIRSLINFGEYSRGD